MGRSILLGLTLSFVAPVFAKPDPDQLMHAPVLRQASDYSFSVLEMDSADGARHYRIWLGRPLKVTDANPVAYLLDGNAAMAALDTELLNRLSHAPAPPVLIAVGYATPLRIERTARTFDYTPTVGAGVQRDPLTDMPSGGADGFLNLLIGSIRPRINQRLEVKPKRQLLWGHSYGGLLVLHALMTRPEAFEAYAAASPSLWWNSGVIGGESSGLQRRLKGNRPTLLLMRGEFEPASPIKVVIPQADAVAKRLLVTLLEVEGLNIHYQVFSGLGHGPMLRASLRYTLERLSQP